MLKSYLITFFISMVPIVELRGAIPYGTLLCNPPVPLLQAYIISIIGNMLPVPIIFFFARKVLEWGADKPIIGGFDQMPGGLINVGNKEDIQKFTEGLLEETGNVGIVVGADCTVPSDTPLCHLEWVREKVNELTTK